MCLAASYCCAPLLAASYCCAHGRISSRMLPPKRRLGRAWAGRQQAAVPTWLLPRLFALPTGLGGAKLPLAASMVEMPCKCEPHARSGQAVGPEPARGEGGAGRVVGAVAALRTACAAQRSLVQRALSKPGVLIDSCFIAGRPGFKQPFPRSEVVLWTPMKPETRHMGALWDPTILCLRRDGGRRRQRGARGEPAPLTPPHGTAS